MVLDNFVLVARCMEKSGDVSYGGEEDFFS